MTTEQQRRARQLVELYKEPDLADPLAHALVGVRNVAHRAAKAAGVNRPATALAHALEKPGYVALKTAETLHKVNDDWESAASGYPNLVTVPFGDWETFVTNPERRREVGAAASRGGLRAALTAAYPNTASMLKQGAVGTIEDVKHPLRHPGFTALDALIAAGGTAALGSRAAAAGRAGALAEGAPILGDSARVGRLGAGKSFARSVELDAPAGGKMVVGRAGGGKLGRVDRAAGAFVRRPADPRLASLAFLKTARGSMRAEERYRLSKRPARSAASFTPFGGTR